MGHQIIKQPDGKLAVFSSVVDDWIIAGATREELGDYYAEDAARKARESALQACDAVLDGEPRAVYYQFTMSYEEACEAAGRTPFDVQDEPANSTT